MKKINVLCLDIEGGHGGSSRSLFYLLKNVNKKKFRIHVICKNSSWLKKEYLKHKINCSVEKTMPCYAPLEILNRNFFSLLYFFIFSWPKSRKFRMRLINKLKKFDILHCNQISLFFLALWIKNKNSNIKITFHIRTMFWPYKKKWHFVYKLAAKIVQKISNKLIFITENEKENLSRVLNLKVSGEILHNPLSDYNSKIKFMKKKIIKIISMSHYDRERGVDRVIELATFIPKIFRNKFQFIMLGDYKHSPSFFEKYFTTISNKNNLKHYARSLNIMNIFKFYGYVKKPELVLKEADILIKLTRRPNPWGRDIIEAMGAGKAIISCGTYSKFVKSNINGLLIKKYEPRKIVRWILKIEKDKNFFIKMKKNSLMRVRRLCSQNRQSLKIEKIWKNLI